MKKMELLSLLIKKEKQKQLKVHLVNLICAVSLTWLIIDLKLLKSSKI